MSHTRRPYISSTDTASHSAFKPHEPFHIPAPAFDLLLGYLPLSLCHSKTLVHTDTYKLLLPLHLQLRLRCDTMEFQSIIDSDNTVVFWGVGVHQNHLPMAGGLMRRAIDFFAGGEYHSTFRVLILMMQSTGY